MGTKELNMVGSVVSTEAVLKNKAVNTRKVKDHDVAKRRRVGTCMANMVLELNDKAEGGESAFFEVVAIPFLSHVSCILLE